MLLGLLKTAAFSLGCVGTIYYALSTCTLARHFRKPGYKQQSGKAPSISVLKPVAGLDTGAQENFESYLHQDYPYFEILFGALDANDPAAPLLESLASASSRASCYTGSRIHGSNNKVRILHNLAGYAHGEILVITDADTRVTPDFLRRITAPFTDPEVDVVTCLYRGIHPASLPDKLESLHMSTLWAPSVASAEALGGISFGLGAAIAIRSDALRKIGGFESIVDYLADDFHLGRKAYRIGGDVVLSDYVIDIVLSHASFSEVVTREVRWSRTTRVSNRAGYLGYGVTFGFVWSLIYWMLSCFSTTGLALVLITSIVRAISAHKCATLLGDKGFTRRLHLLPARDMLSFITWISGFASDTIQWRGRRLRLLRNGMMVATKDSR